MPGTGQTTAAKASGLHTKIASVFLDQDISGDLGGAKQAVHRLVDAHRLVDPVTPKSMVVRQLPAGALLDERQPIRRVAVDFVGAGKDEACIRTVLPCCLQEIERAAGIDREIDKRRFSR